MPNETLILVKEVTGSGNTREAPLNAKFDEQKLIGNVQPAEFRWVEPLLGTDLYEAMITASAAATVPITEPKFVNTAYQTLWTKYLKAYCAFAVVLQSMPYIAIKIGSNGLIMENTTTGDNAGVGGLKFLQDTNSATLQVYAEKISTYLCKNATDFPEYEHHNCKCGGKNKLHSAGNNRIIIPTPNKDHNRHSRKRNIYR